MVGSGYQDHFFSEASVMSPPPLFLEDPVWMLDKSELSKLKVAQNETLGPELRRSTSSKGVVLKVLKL